ncbi:tetratricopeptide repeat protein [Micromonospora sp. WMMD882]|uniref:tetratricopeptide repeat protein n=1 Tax=Micromonospora sp. WMMD882 TaxID=3015151 RepID=UPI00248C1A9A|nr:tetratricopeptide repeat protein [Micromonospora sp. WMMD882]WBB78899.1 tetratricopeptide repeat protein [Micromonospora sp. WMMD882]
MTPEPSETTPGPEPTESYLQRAQLLAELGRYDEAAGELTHVLARDPAHVPASTMLARLHLAADRPAAALDAAQTAVAAAPGTVEPLVTRALALIDLREFAPAARTADEILALGPDDAYAQRSAAAILAEARNGQPALNAAWRGVELAPEQPQAHLVLGLVAARLGLFSLAERAYAEALRLDPELAEARHDIGVLRLEQRRYAEALEHLAEAAAIGPRPVEPGRDGAGQGGPARIDPRRTISGELRRLIAYGAGWCLVATVTVACLAASGGWSRVFAAVAALGAALVVWRYAAKLPGLTRTVLPELLRTDRTLALAVYAVVAAPALILLYALVGTPWPLVLAIVLAAIAELAAFSRPVR